MKKNNFIIACSVLVILSGMTYFYLGKTLLPLINDIPITIKLVIGVSFFSCCFAIIANRYSTSTHLSLKDLEKIKKIKEVKKIEEAAKKEKIEKIEKLLAQLAKVAESEKLTKSEKITKLEKVLVKLEALGVTERMLTRKAIIIDIFSHDITNINSIIAPMYNITDARCPYNVLDIG